MVSEIKNQLYMDDGLGFPASFTAATASAIYKGFVNIVSGSNWTIENSIKSGTSKPPIGVAMQSAASGTSAIEVRSTGYVQMLLRATVAGPAGSPVYPASAGTGRIIITGAVDASGNAIFPGGFGTIIQGGSSGAVVLVKLANLY